VGEKTASACRRIATRIADVHTPQSSSFLRCIIIIIIIISYTRRNPLFQTRDKALPPLTLLSRTHSDIRNHFPPIIFFYQPRLPQPPPSIVFDLTHLVHLYFIIYSVSLSSQTRNKYL
jgi:hypothetical protein